jgi:DNA-binding LacI/PurR family transcriptional regulator
VGFTAVFAASDMVALGAPAALREAGLDVPGGDDHVVLSTQLVIRQSVRPPD